MDRGAECCGRQAPIPRCDSLLGALEREQTSDWRGPGGLSLFRRPAGRHYEWRRQPGRDPGLEELLPLLRLSGRGRPRALGPWQPCHPGGHLPASQALACDLPRSTGASTSFRVERLRASCLRTWLRRSQPCGHKTYFPFESAQTRAINDPFGPIWTHLVRESS